MASIGGFFLFVVAVMTGLCILGIVGGKTLAWWRMRRVQKIWDESFAKYESENEGARRE